MNLDSTTTISAATETVCYHCGDRVGEGGVVEGEKSFCCAGCRTVFQILHENDLCRYYDLQATPGTTPLLNATGRYAYLDDAAIAAQVLSFSDARSSAVTFRVPGMHCASCVWLLEHLYRLNEGVLESRADFIRKEIHVRFDRRTSLRAVVELLASIGYEPELNLGTLHRRADDQQHRWLTARVGVAGFCFGNIMLLSFPEYFATSNVDVDLRQLFNWVMLGLALPVVFYSASGYFVSAWRGLRRFTINIDVPLALGIGILFVRSVYDITIMGRAGFFDSLAGLVFFLLIGKVVQRRTFDKLNFDRDFSSYFPLAVTVRKNGSEMTVPVTRLAPGDKMLIRNREVIPADGMILNGTGTIDYSFVTGEADPVPRSAGDVVYAGGRQTGPAVEIQVLKEVSRSHLTQLWDRDATGHSEKSRLLTLSNSAGKWFTLIVLGITAGTATWWLVVDPSRTLDAVTGILIVSCPCALALAAPFAFGAVQFVLGRHSFYVKNTAVVEALAKVDTVVFDKTGTLTPGRSARITYEGVPLDKGQRSVVRSLVRNSTHPLSRLLELHLADAEVIALDAFNEVVGGGIRGWHDGVEVRLGSAAFAHGGQTGNVERETAATVHVSVGERSAGAFVVRQEYRPGLGAVLEALAPGYHLELLTGDHQGERKMLEAMFPPGSAMRFSQSPFDKQDRVRELQEDGRRVLMLGDGLNDAGALARSNVGAAVTDDVNAFSPACDAILDGASLRRLPDFLSLSRAAITIVLASFGVSLLYNLGGLWFAVQGALSPVLAAILMPLSSVTVTAASTLSVMAAAKRRNLA